MLYEVITENVIRQRYGYLSGEVSRAEKDLIASKAVSDGGEASAFGGRPASTTRITSYNVCYTKLLRYLYLVFSLEPFGWVGLPIGVTQTARTPIPGDCFIMD